jgi:hypothetical protein
MSRFWELLTETRRVAKEADDMSTRIDPYHALERCKRLENMIDGILWLHGQTLKELARRDGIDVSQLPPV